MLSSQFALNMRVCFLFSMSHHRHVIKAIFSSLPRFTSHYLCHTDSWSRDFGVPLSTTRRCCCFHLHQDWRYYTATHIGRDGGVGSPGSSSSSPTKGLLKFIPIETASELFDSGWRSNRTLLGLSVPIGINHIASHTAAHRPTGDFGETSFSEFHFPGSLQDNMITLSRTS